MNMAVINDMEKANHALIDLRLVVFASLILMAYGWYLRQLHQSGYYVASIFLSITGLIGLMFARLHR